MKISGKVYSRSTHNADENTEDKDGYTPLHWCTLMGNENLCRLLLEHNADVNIQDNRDLKI